MAAIYEEHSDNRNSENGNGNEISRKDIQSAIAKAVELRALHAALMQGNRNSPANISLPSASPVSRHAPNLSAQDYPIFTPSYEDEPLTGYQQSLTTNASSRKGLPSELMNLEGHICPPTIEFRGGFALRASPGPDYSKSRRNSLGDIKSVSSCNKCKPAVIGNDLESLAKNGKKLNVVVPLTDSHSSLNPQPRNKGLSLSWIFPKLKKKNKNENSPIRPKPEEMSQMLKDFGILSVETLKSELMEAHESRDSALNEVTELKSSLGELSQKLEYLETYCEELKKALKQAVQVKNFPQHVEKLTNFPKRGKPGDGNEIPVTEEVMVEGFLQIVSEARLSVKQFCKTLVKQIEETDHTLLDNLNTLLQPYKLSLNSKYSKAVLYHLEGIINQSLYQDFENCVFQKNGTPKLLDPQQERQAQFQLFVALRNLSWNEVLRKGTKYYSDEFSKFCDQKMSGIIATLGWTRPWPEQLLQAFFVAAKCIWLLHLLAFSFDPPLGILRVDENRSFEPHYMEDIFLDKQRPQGPSRVKIMVMPGFYVHDEVLKCKVLCRYKSVV
ncbi:hypothetical protein DH2020_001082 [Rehmannia glutinosa]|uniref:IRK-interacting protein n=1 Tax=Rehmannia glutinosa TaxID=99300 RepID=A0ABR0XYR2_REHGL